MTAATGLPTEPLTVNHPADELVATQAGPVLGEVLRRARQHCGFSLRQVEQRSGIANAHLSQIERGSIRKPDPVLLMELAELYQLNFQLIAEWSGHLDESSPRASNLAGLALRLFVDLDTTQQHEALRYMEILRSQQAR